jgi:alkanesulfonate monooxygenase SsuD/methylene tetrahydromethanopterin reductase-like flavin-dependent oxidoreductase (luciferase family)
MTDVGKERGRPPMTRANFDAQRGPNGALLVDSPDEVVDKILRHREALGGIVRVSFMMTGEDDARHRRDWCAHRASVAWSDGCDLSAQVHSRKEFAELD